VALAYVDDERGALYGCVIVFSGFDQAGKGWQERDRQIINAEVAKVFKSVGGRGHARTAEARDDDYIGRINPCAVRLFFIRHHQP